MTIALIFIGQALAMGLAFALLQTTQVDPTMSLIITALIGYLVGWLGPKPADAILKALHLSGLWAVFGLYVIAFLVSGVGALIGLALCRIPILNICFAPGDVFTGVVFVALGAQMAFHKLKDEGKIAAKPTSHA